MEKEGVHFLGYINPYVAIEKELYAEAAEKGYLTKDYDGKDYQVEFGEFYAGVVDLTKPEAYDWYKNVIKKNLIRIWPRRLDGGLWRISADRYRFA